MPDFTIECFWCCESAMSWSATVGGHRVDFGKLPPGADYEFGYACDCTGYKFRHTCRHVKAAEALRCGWQAFAHGGEPVDGKCPRCGGNVTAESYAV